MFKMLILASSRPHSTSFCSLHTPRRSHILLFHFDMVLILVFLKELLLESLPLMAHCVWKIVLTREISSVLTSFLPSSSPRLFLRSYHSLVCVENLALVLLQSLR